MYVQNASFSGVASQEMILTVLYGTVIMYGKVLEKHVSSLYILLLNCMALYVYCICYLSLTHTLSAHYKEVSSTTK